MARLESKRRDIFEEFFLLVNIPLIQEMIFTFI